MLELADVVMCDREVRQTDVVMCDSERHKNPMTYFLLFSLSKTATFVWMQRGREDHGWWMSAFADRGIVWVQRGTEEVADERVCLEGHWVCVERERRAWLMNEFAKKGIECV